MEADKTITPTVVLEVEKTAKLHIEIAGKHFYLTCDKDSPLGALHDALMQFKGWCVNRLVENQKVESENAETVKAQDSEKFYENSCSQEE